MKPFDKLESDIEKAIVEAATALGWWTVKIMSASKRGLPDRLFVREGRHVWMEVKRLGRIPRPQQQKRIAELVAAGAEVHVVDNLDAARRILA